MGDVASVVGTLGELVTRQSPPPPQPHEKGRGKLQLKTCITLQCFLESDLQVFACEWRRAESIFELEARKLHIWGIEFLTLAHLFGISDA